MTRRARWVLAAFVLLAAACGGGQPAQQPPAESGAEPAAGGDRADWPDKLVFAAVPAEQSDRLQDNYQTTIDLLAAETGLEIEFFQAADYAGVIEAMIADRVDVAQFGPFSYVIAKANGAEIVPVGAAIDAEGEEPGYQSYGITRGDNAGVDGIEDFAGKRTCFVDPGSTSGFLFPSAGLLAMGINPETGVQPVFAGGHDASVLSVVNGDCEVGFAYDDMVDTDLIESGDIQQGAVKVVWRSETIPGSPVAMRTGLPQSLQDVITTTITEKANIAYATENGFCATPEECALSDEGDYGFVAVIDSIYDAIRQVCETTRSAECEGA